MSQERNIEERLHNRVENLGFSDNVKKQVSENVNDGLIEFSALESIKIGNHKMDYELIFSPGKGEHSHTPYLNEIDVLLQKPIEISHTVIDGVQTQVIENLLQPIDPDGFPDQMKHEKELFEQERITEVQKQMKWLMEENPAIFNSLMVKYKPQLDFPIPADLQKQQEELQLGLVKYNKFSTYFNLTALEMYNVMEGRAALKTLFKKSTNVEGVSAEEGQQKAQSLSFRSWAKANFENRRPDGSAEIILLPQGRAIGKILKDYNFDETNNRHTIGDVIRFLEKGSQFIVTTGDQKIKIQADAGKDDIKMFKLTGEPIYNHKLYLKNQYAMEMGEAVEIKKSDRPGEPLSANVQPISKEEKLQQSAKFGQYREKAEAVGKDQLERSETKVDKITVRTKNDKKGEKPVTLRNRKNERVMGTDTVKNSIGR